MFGGRGDDHFRFSSRDRILLKFVDTDSWEKGKFLVFVFALRECTL